MPRAIVREAVEKINGGFPDLVRIHLGNDAWASILVIGVDFSTDPNAYADFDTAGVLRRSLVSR